MNDRDRDVWTSHLIILKQQRDRMTRNATNLLESIDYLNQAIEFFETYLKKDRSKPGDNKE